METINSIAAKALPALSMSSLTYNPKKKVYLTVGYTSAAGNTYYKALRLSKRLIVYYELGQGYAHTFLNGIKLFAWNGMKPRLIAHKTWGGTEDWIEFQENTAFEMSVSMLKEFLEGQVKAMGDFVNENQLMAFARDMMEETHNPRIEARIA